MRVFASDLDGCLADTAGLIEEAAEEWFGVSAEDEDYLDIQELRVKDQDEWDRFIKTTFDSGKFILAARPILENINELQKWSVRAVPSIITARNPTSRNYTEQWMANHKVPYSNLLLGVDNKGEACRIIDASFIVEDSPINAQEVQDHTNGYCKGYVVRTPYNVYAEPDFPNLIWVDSYKDITELEFNVEG